MGSESALRRNVRKIKSTLRLYPVKVALILVLPSLVLYLFFMIWPIMFSVYLAFTDANNYNIAPSPTKLQSLYELRANITSKLDENKELIQNYAREAKTLIESIQSDLNALREYLIEVNKTGGQVDTTIIRQYLESIQDKMDKLVVIVKDENTFFLRYKPIGENVSTANSVFQEKLVAKLQTIVYFPLGGAELTKEDIAEIISGIDIISSSLKKAYDGFDVVVTDYESFKKGVVKDIDEEIDKLTLHFVGVENIEKLFTDARFVYSILKTLLFVATSVPLKVAVGVALALFFSTPYVYGRKVMRALLLTPWALPVLLSVTTWRMLFLPREGVMAKLFSSIIGTSFEIFTNEWHAFIAYNIVEMWLAYPFIMTVVMGAIAGIPKEIIEASYIDGAGPWLRFRKIILPEIASSIMFVTILTTGASLQAFMVPLLINGGGPAGTIRIFGLPPKIGNLNEMLILFGYNRAYIDREYGYAAAAYLVAVLFLMVYVMIWFKYIRPKGGGQ